MHHNAKAVSGCFASRCLKNNCSSSATTTAKRGDRRLTMSYSESLPFILAQAIHSLRTMELWVSSMLSFENMLRRKLDLPTAIKVEIIVKPKTATMPTTMAPTNSSCSSCENTIGICQMIEIEADVIGGYVLVSEMGSKLFQQRCLIKLACSGSRSLVYSRLICKAD